MSARCWGALVLDVLMFGCLGAVYVAAMWLYALTGWAVPAVVRR